MWHFEVEEIPIPIKARHPESNGGTEHHHRSVSVEDCGSIEVEDLYRARDTLAAQVKY
jgi:hypothetical protein